MMKHLRKYIELLGINSDEAEHLETLVTLAFHLFAEDTTETYLKIPGVGTFRKRIGESREVTTPNGHVSRLKEYTASVFKSSSLFKKALNRSRNDQSKIEEDEFLPMLEHLKELKAPIHASSSSDPDD